MLTVTVRASDGHDRRDYDRTTVNRASTARGSNALPYDVVVGDFSREGIGFTSSVSFDVGSEITIGLSGGGSVNGHIVRRNRDLYGCTFVQPLDHKQMEDAFGVSAVRPFQPEASQRSAGEIPTIPRWSGASRLAVLLVGAIGSWAAVAALVYFTLARS